MKIVLAIFKYFPYGGLQLDFIRIARKLTERGHRVICCTGSWTGDVPDGMELHTIRLRSWSNHGRAAEFERKFRQFIETEKPDRTVVFNRMSGGDFYFAADNCLLPLWQKKHSEFVLHFFPRYRIFARQERAVFDLSSRTKILYIVESQKREYQQTYATPEARFIYLPPGMNTACRRPENALAIRKAERERLGLKPDEILFIMIAAQFQIKGADRVIRAMAHLPERVRNTCKLLLCGDRKKADFKELAKECGVADQVIVLGPSDNVPALLQAADLMVHPARIEATGTVLTEAIIAGLPAICSGLCGFSDFVRDAGGIVLAEPYRDEDLLAA